MSGLIPTLEQLELDVVSLSGRGELAQNRLFDGHCQIQATNDYEAAASWLNEYKDSPNTFRKYQAEVDRLLLWCVIQKRKPLSGLFRQDFDEYFEFIKNPSPRQVWCGEKRGGRGNKRFSTTWKPFSGNVSQSSLTLTKNTLCSLFSYLVDAGYLRSNPLALIRRTIKTHQQEPVADERILDDEEWKAVKDTLNDLPESTNREKEIKLRYELLIAILYLASLRVQAVADLKWSNFKCIRGSQWWIYSIGKGGKLTKVPVPNLMKKVRGYRMHLGLQPIPSADEETAVFIGIDTRKPLTAGHLRKVFKELMYLAARKLEDKPGKANKLIKCSPHWLRHLSGSHQDDMGLDEKMIQKNFGHSSITTTKNLYIHKLDDNRYEKQKSIDF